MVSPNVKDMDKHHLDPYVKKQNAKLTQVVQNFFTKAVQIILSSRSEIIEPVESQEQRINKWFNILLPSNSSGPTNKEELKLWKSCSDLSVIPPMIIETSVNLRDLSGNNTVILKDDNDNPWTVVKGGSKKQEVVIERWLIEFDSTEVSGSIMDELPLIYKQAIILFRSLYGYLRLMPAYKLRQKLKKESNTSNNKNQLSMSNKILDGKQPISSKGRIGLSKPIIPHQMLTTDSHLIQRNFHPIQTTLGTLKVSIVYRRHHDFCIKDSEEMLSNHFMKLDNTIKQRTHDDDEQSSSQDVIPKEDEDANLEPIDTSEHESSNKESEDSHIVEHQQHHHRQSTNDREGPFGKSRSISPSTVREYSPSKKSAVASTEPSRPTIQPFKSGSIGNSPPPVSSGTPTNFGPSSLERRISITSNKSTSNASLAAMLRNPRGSISSTTANIPIANANNNNNQTIISSIPKSISSSHGSNLAHEMDLPNPESVSTGGNVSIGGSGGTPRFSSSFGSRAGRRFSNTSVRQSILQQNYDQSLLGTSAGLVSSTNPLSGLYIDDDISDFVRMIDSKNDLRFSNHPSSGLGGGIGGDRVNMGSNSQIDALNKFQSLRDQHQQLGDSVNQSLILQANASIPQSINNPNQFSGDSNSRKSSTHSQSIYSPISPSPFDNRSNSSSHNLATADSKVTGNYQKSDKKMLPGDNSRAAISTRGVNSRLQSEHPEPLPPGTTATAGNSVPTTATTPTGVVAGGSSKFNKTGYKNEGDVKGLATTPSVYANRRSIQYENVFDDDDDGEDYYLQLKQTRQKSQPEEEDDDLLFTMSDMNLTKNYN